MIYTSHKILSVWSKKKKHEMSRPCSTHGREKGCIQGLVGKPEGKRSLGTSWPIREDDIKMDL
jgi:hypothetical protein